MLVQLNSTQQKEKTLREMQACIIGIQILNEGNFGKSPEELLEIIKARCNNDEALITTTLNLLIACLKD